MLMRHAPWQAKRRSEAKDLRQLVHFGPLSRRVIWLPIFSPISARMGSSRRRQLVAGLDPLFEVQREPSMK
jgi:hypothetical protein